MDKQSALLLFLLCGLLAGCAQFPADRFSSESGVAFEDRNLLAGEWEYEDGAAVLLQLDEEGNGTYAYKEGRFETTEFDGRIWAGKWYQKENDREGGFVVKLSPDRREGNGTWWYVRIGEDVAPTQKGGHFRLSKKATLTRLGEARQAP